ncbi:hypothetical protein FKM82_009305 [Ascaphus truei]
METNNRFACTGQPPIPNASGLKRLPQSVETVYTNSALVSFPQQGKGLNGDMQVNGLTSSSSIPTNVHGTFSSDVGSPHHPVSTTYDYLWNYPKSPIRKDCHGPGQYQVNGSTSAMTNGPSCKGNGTPGHAASLGFNGQDMCNFNDPNGKVASAANGTPHGCYEASRPVPMLASSMQAFSPLTQCIGKQKEEAGSGTTEGLPSGTMENDLGLVEGLEPSDVQADLRICEDNRTNLVLAALRQMVPSPPSPPDVSNLDDPSQLPSQLGDSHLLSSDSLEPFGADLSQGSNNLYDLEELGVQEDKVPLVEGSGLDCPPFSNSASFPLVAEDSRNSATLFNATSASPVLGDSVMQDSASEMEEDPEGSRAEEPNTTLEKDLGNVSLDENLAETTSMDPSVAPETEGLEPGEVKGNFSRRRIATPEEVRLPLLHGWNREVRIKKGSHRWQGETWYYAPCGKRMKQFPEVIKYLSKNISPLVRREHFSFSPRMPVGDFYEERDTVVGLEWVQLRSEEIPSRIVAITGKRGRPRNMEKAKAKADKVKRGRGRPPKVKVINLLNKPDAKLMKKLENQEVLSDEDKLKLRKLKKKMRRKARNQEAKQEAKKKSKIKDKKGKKEKRQKGNEKTQAKVRRKSKEKANPIAQKPDKRQLAQQRRLEERRRQQFILEELKKPTEDMCLSDHQLLPPFPRVPGLVLPSCAFSNCLTTVEFLHGYGKVLGFDCTREVPSLCTLQEGLFNVGDSLGEVQDLLVKLMRVAMSDPGLPPYCQSLKILGEKVSEISLNRDNVSEALRLFLEAYGGDVELCESLRSHPFQAHPPQTKAAMLTFLINELNASTLIINEIDKTLENMSHYRKNKWIIEGKIRRLKLALARKTDSPESPITCPVDGRRRRSTRITEENEELEGDDGLLQKSCIEEEEEAPSCVSFVELERQIEKLTKRKMFFRKKLLHSSQRLRSVSLGQDRYRRRYWMLPHLGGIFVEGSAEGAAVKDCPTGQTEEPLQAEMSPISSVKTEAADVPIAEGKAFNPPNRSRGRPRKPKAEPEHLCKSHHCSGARDSALNGILDHSSPIVPVSESQQDLSQSAFLAWLSQNQTSLMNSTVLTPESSPPHTEATPTLPTEPHAGDKEAPEKQGQWFHLLPRTPCSDPSQNCSTQPSSLLPPASPAAATPARQANGLSEEGVPVADTPLPSAFTPCQACSHPRRNSTTSHVKPQSSYPVHGPGQVKRRGRPPSKLFKQIEQKYCSQLTERPIPAEMRHNWWWIKDPGMLESLLKALHPRGIREKTLHKHLAKHQEYLKEMCARPASDALFEFTTRADHPVCQETLEKWSVTERTFQVDLSILQWVEDLEQRICLADLQQRGWTISSLDSIRSDLKYFEHQLEATDDITVKIKKEEGRPHREPANPLDLAVLRLLELEHNVERRYLKEPLWLLNDVQHEKAVLTDPEGQFSTIEIEYTTTPRLRLWRQTVERCRSAAQLSLCLQQLEKSIAWERSVNKVTCLVCRKGDNDEYLLLCDSCDRGCHTYCHRPRITQVPEGDWFCPTCVSLQGESEFLRSCGSSRRAKKRVLRYQEYDSPSNPSRQREQAAVFQYSAEASLSKRKRMATRSQSPDLTFCEIILMEMESHEEAWPFLEPVDPRLVPDYRKVIRHPMDFSTMRHKLLNGK